MSTANPCPTTWRATEAPVGHFSVLRALPTAEVSSVGPFVFLDHFGPFPASPETLPAHPHAGIEVMTYLLEGANEHRDSMGHQGVIEAGGAQWMRAGRGILHAETNLPELAPTIHGLQIWARLRTEHQWMEPAYQAIGASAVAAWSMDGVSYRLLSGVLGQQRGPIPLMAPALMLHLQLAPGAQTHLDLSEHAAFEFGAYGIAGAVMVDGQMLERGQFRRWAGSAGVVGFQNNGEQAVDLMLLGGAPVLGPLVFGGPFVLDSRESLQRAQRDYFAGRMGQLDGVPG